MVLTVLALAWPLTLVIVVALCSAARLGERVRVEPEVSVTRASVQPELTATEALLELGYAA